MDRREYFFRTTFLAARQIIVWDVNLVRDLQDRMALPIQITLSSQEAPIVCNDPIRWVDNWMLARRESRLQLFVELEDQFVKVTAFGGKGASSVQLSATPGPRRKAMDLDFW